MTQPPNPPGEFPQGGVPQGDVPQGGGYPPAGGFPPPPPGGYPPPPAGGFPPPSPGGFPPPPPGWGQGYPPPPPPGYGYPPPPPAAGGYFPPPPGYGAPAKSYSVGEALSWAWAKFTKNPLPLIVATLVFGLILVVLNALMQPLIRAASPETYNAIDVSGDLVTSTTQTITAAGIAVLILSLLVHMVVEAAIASGYYGGMLDIANGQPVAIGSFFRPRNIVSVIIASLIVGVLTAIGTVLCILPGLIVSIFTVFSTVAIVDRNLSPIDGIKASFQIVKENFGPVLLAWLTSVAIMLVGALLCGVGLLVAAPVTYLFIVYTYRKLSGGSVAPAIS